VRTRRITLWMVGTIAVLILLFSYRTSLGAATPTPGPAAAAPGVVPPSGLSPSASSSTRPRTQADTTTVNGTVAQTRWGPVQVQVRIDNGHIVDVRALQQPTGSDRDTEINGYALPRLRDEVLAAQSAHIDMVSGATVTSGGYVESLQAALDAAHFG
jgi:uncharacterized protein with FMN-binding domain